MSTLNVLDFVTRELEGRIITVSSLSAYIAAEKAADRLAMTATSREAAQLAVLLPSAPLERIRNEFGAAIADIVEALRPNGPFSRIASRAMAMHGRSEGNMNRKDAAIAAFAAEAATASPDDGKSMNSFLDGMLDWEIEPKRKGFLKELRTKLPQPAPADPERQERDRRRVISISMDVCGSTKAKARMRKRARSDADR